MQGPEARKGHASVIHAAERIAVRCDHPDAMDTMEDEESTRTLSLSSTVSAWSVPATRSEEETPAVKFHPQRRASQGSVQAVQSPVSRFLSKDNPHTLRLPSFPSLTALALPSHSNAMHASFSTDHASRGRLPTLDTTPDRPSGNYASSLPLTPPADDEEDDHVRWNAPASVVQVGVAHITRREPKPQTRMDEGSPSERRTEATDTVNQNHSGKSPAEDIQMSGLGLQDEQPSGSWLADSIDATLSSLMDANPGGDAVCLVSQTLPYPRAADQSVRLPTQNSVFGSIVQTIQDRLQPGQSPYINVIHAVPEEFSLSNLPTSPPSTPSHGMQLNDYFNSTVFCTAAPVPASYNFRGEVRPAHTPFPIAIPHSIHISVVDRYLPPATKEEYRNMFCHDPPSTLTDRLQELSSSGGSMLFIYPTKRGAMTFKTQYLGPILDPLLRQLVVVNGLPADMGRVLGRLETVNHMDDFEIMKANLVRLCERISDTASRFTVVEAGTGTAELDRNLWTEWYIHQERPRMKDLLTRYWQASGRPTSAVHSHGPSTLLGEILDGIKKRRYDIEPRDGVELGVFVIRRSH